MRQHPKVLNLPWVEKIRRADRDNTIDVYISDDYDDVLADGVWQQFFTEKPEVQAGGSVRDDHVIETCDKYGIVMAFTGIRLFHH